MRCGRLLDEFSISRAKLLGLSYGQGTSAKSVFANERDTRGMIYTLLVGYGKGFVGKDDDNDHGKKESGEILRKRRNVFCSDGNIFYHFNGGSVYLS